MRSPDGAGFAKRSRQISPPFALRPLSGHSRLNQRLTVPRSGTRLLGAAYASADFAARVRRTAWPRLPSA